MVLVAAAGSLIAVNPSPAQVLVLLVLLCCCQAATMPVRPVPYSPYSLLLLSCLLAVTTAFPANPPSHLAATQS